MTLLSMEVIKVADQPLGGTGGAGFAAEGNKQSL